MNAGAITGGLIAALAVGALVWRHQGAGAVEAALRKEAATAIAQAEELKMKLGHQEQLVTVTSNRVQEMEASLVGWSNRVAVVTRQLKAEEAARAEASGEILAKNAAVKNLESRAADLARELATSMATLEEERARVRAVSQLQKSTEADRDRLAQLHRSEAAERERLLWKWNDWEAVNAQQAALAARRLEAKAAEKKALASPAPTGPLAEHGSGRLLQLPILPKAPDDGVLLLLQPDGSVKPAAAPPR